MIRCETYRVHSPTFTKERAVRPLYPSADGSYRGPDLALQLSNSGKRGRDYLEVPMSSSMYVAEFLQNPPVLALYARNESFSPEPRRQDSHRVSFYLKMAHAMRDCLAEKTGS